MLTEEQKIARQGKLTASQIGILLRGDAEKLLSLWKEVVGDPSFVPPDFSDNWPVQLGVTTEDLNLHWYAKFQATEVTRAGEVVTHPNGWAANTLDGWDVVRDIPVQAKHVNAYKKFEDVVDYYLPQLHWEMFVNDRKTIAFTVIIGSNEPKVEFVEFNQEYFDELYLRAESFMICVRNLIPPVEINPVFSPEKIEKYRIMDFTGNNEFLSFAHDWKENKDGAKKFEKADAGIKRMIAVDVGLATGGGIQVKRDAAGRLRISETKI